MFYRFFIAISMLVVVGGGCSAQQSSAISTGQSDVPAEDSGAQAVDGLGGENGVVDEIATDVTANEETELAMPALDVSMQAGNFFYEGEVINARPGQEVTVVFSHVDGSHTFVIDDLDIRTTMSTNGSVTFVAPITPGEYPYYCDVGGHRKLGMEGKLIVE
ncbi:MAG: cupredoxin domain-containing protein [Candidatus Uhrbacteria bacterium]|nr:cupredoxin domain-containing protein [Candidatus Uhrbacteria bacterium]